MRTKWFPVYWILIISLYSLTCVPVQRDIYPERGEVRIVTDKYGVPHIYASKETEAIYGLGYSHARNRLKQVFSSKLTAAGRISEILGSRTLEQDHTMRLFRLYERAEHILLEMDSEYKEIVYAYCRGINDYLDAKGNEIPQWINEFKPEDLVAVAMMINLYFPMNTMRRDIRKGHLGSNQFAVGPKRSENGHAILAMDPHLNFSGAFVWMEAHLSTPDLSIIGCTIPGLPFVGMGHNGNVAWCSTNNNPDLADIYMFQINPADPTRYKGPDGWMTFESHEEILRYKTREGTKEQKVTMLQTHVGPVLEIKNGFAYAGRVAGFDSPEMLKQMFKRAKAKTVRELINTYRIHGMAMWNIMAADTEGNIGYLYNAILPDRDPSLDWSRPVAGDDPRSVWNGFIAFESLPQVINPATGWLQNCNDPPWFVTTGDVIKRDNLPFRLVNSSDMGERSKRIIQLISDKDKITLDDMMAYTTDVRVVPAGLWVPKLISAYEKYEKRMSLKGSDTEEAIRLLKDWDLRCDAKSRCMTLFYAWYRRGNLRHIVRVSQITDNIAQKQLLELGSAAADVKRIFGRLDVPWGQILHLRHGPVEVPLSGGGGMFPVVRSAYGVLNQEGRIPVTSGSSYMMVVEMAPVPTAYSSFPLGINEDPNSSHFADMTRLYSRMEYKPVYYTWKELKPNIESDEVLEIGLE